MPMFLISGTTWKPTLMTWKTSCDSWGVARTTSTNLWALTDSPQVSPLPKRHFGAQAKPLFSRRLLQMMPIGRAQWTSLQRG